MQAKQFCVLTTTESRAKIWRLSLLVTLAAVLSKAVVLLLLINCLVYFPLFMGALRLSLFWYALLCVLSSFAIILKRKRELVALLLSMSYRCLVTLNILWLFLTVLWVNLQCAIVVFPDHTHLLFCSFCWTTWTRAYLLFLLIILNFNQVCLIK